jgi:hypothetical protein
MQTDEACAFLCERTLDAKMAKKFQVRVKEDYRVNMCALEM